jgi:hypothetical protein
MSFLLDTNICSAHLKRPAGLMRRFVQHWGGLRSGLQRSGRLRPDDFAERLALLELTKRFPDGGEFKEQPNLTVDHSGLD